VLVHLENVVDTFAIWLIGEHCCAQILHYF